MFEEFTEEYLMEQAREHGQRLGVDTRQGSVYMDACTAHIMRVAKFYDDLRSTFDMLSDDTCTGDVLEEKAKQRQIFRKGATPSYYNAEFAGVSGEELIGNRFMVDGYYFTLDAYDGGYYLRSEVLGTKTNYILPGQLLIPMRNTKGLTSATLGELYVVGADSESDENLRNRYKESIAKPAENGNKQQYKIWCSNYEGVGRVIITSLPFGPNTVKAVIIGAGGRAPAEALILQIQEDIDPGSSGLGEGKAPIGSHFYAKAASEIEIDVSFNAQIATGHTKETTLVSAKRYLSEYLRDVALNASDNDEMLIQYVKVIGILADTPGIKDFSDLRLNDSAENVTIEADNVGVLGEVAMSVSV